MSMKVVPGIAVALTLLAGMAWANDAANIQQSSSEMPVQVYPMGASTHYCPQGLVPVSVDGTVSCGMPTSELTYAQVKATPYGARGYAYCPAGTKGCN